MPASATAHSIDFAVNPSLSKKKKRAGTRNATRQTTRMPWYTAAALSLRNPAFASVTRSEFFSSSVAGSITPPRMENASVSPLNRPWVST